MYKVTFIFASILILTVGLQTSLLKSLGLNPSLSLISPFFLFLATLKHYFKNDTKDILIYVVIFWVLIKLLLIQNLYAFDLLQALILTLIFKKFSMSMTANNCRRVQWILYTSGFLGFIGFMQLFSVQLVSGIQPLMNSDFVGSGGFSGFSILRPNFGLGNSLNVGLFFILNIFLAYTMSDILSKKVYYFLIILFTGCIFLTLSRTALLQLIVLIPTLISSLGYSVILAGIVLLYMLTYEFIYFFYLRIIGGEFTAGSYQERFEIIQSFFDSLNIHVHFIGTLSTNYPKITDGLLLNVYQSVGSIFTIFYLMGTFRLHTFALRSNIIFIILILISLLFTNSFYAYYNLFVLMIILRLLDIRSHASR